MSDERERETRCDCWCVTMARRFDRSSFHIATSIYSSSSPSRSSVLLQLFLYEYNKRAYRSMTMNRHFEHLFVSRCCPSIILSLIVHPYLLGHRTSRRGVRRWVRVCQKEGEKRKTNAMIDLAMESSLLYLMIYLWQKTTMLRLLPALCLDRWWLNLVRRHWKIWSLLCRGQLEDLLLIDTCSMVHRAHWHPFDSVDRTISVNYESENAHSNSALHHNLRDIDKCPILRQTSESEMTKRSDQSSEQRTLLFTKDWSHIVFFDRLLLVKMIVVRWNDQIFRLTFGFQIAQRW